MWVLLNGMLYNLYHVASITLPKGGEDKYYFTMIFKDGSDERFSYSDWNKCEKQYRKIFSVINFTDNLGEPLGLMKPIRGIDLANNKPNNDCDIEHVCNEYCLPPSERRV